MLRSERRRSFSSGAMGVALGLCLPALFAGTPRAEPLLHCVSTPAQLAAALLQAQGNGVPDEIRLVAGNYPGSFDYSSSEVQGLALTGGYDDLCLSRQDDAAVTVLDGGGAARPLRIASSVRVPFTLEGFSIRNGVSTGNGGGLLVECSAGCDVVMTAVTVADNAVTSGGRGGGIHCQGSTLALHGCRLTGNSASLYGGGLSVRGPGSVRFSALSIDDCAFEGNMAVGGGGVYAYATDAMTVRRTDFRGNDAGSEGGGGIYAPFGGSILVDSSTLAGNTSGSSGGGLFLFVGTVDLVNTASWGNSASTDGGGGRIEGARLTLTGNSFAANSAAVAAGGLRLGLTTNTAVARLHNNIVWGNSAPETADLFIYDEGTKAGDGIYALVELHDNDFDQTAAGFGIVNPSFVIDPSNLDQDPLFLDPAADFRLGEGSPCLDAGDGAAPLLPATDHDGLPRVLGAAVDLGAWERPPAPDPPSGVLAGDGLQADRVVVSWEEEALAEGYRIYRSDGIGGEFLAVGETDARTLFFEDPLACGGGDYTYRVTAFNYAGESAPSAQDAGSTAACPPEPLIGLSATFLETTCPAGTDAPHGYFEVSNSGEGSLEFDVSDDADWLTCSPESGSAAPGPVPVTVTYATSSLPPGTHEATITVAGNASNSPVTLQVVLTVSDLRFFDDFSDGSVTDGDWRLETGSWRVTPGLALKSSRRGNAVALVDGLPVAAGHVEARLRLTPYFSTAANASLVFAFQGSDVYRYVRLRAGRVDIGQRGSFGDGEEAGVKVSRKRAIRIGRWNDLLVDIHPDGLVEVFRRSDGRRLASHSFPSSPVGEVGFLTRKASALFDDLSVRDPSAIP